MLIVIVVNRPTDVFEVSVNGALKFLDDITYIDESIGLFENDALKKSLGIPQCYGDFGTFTPFFILSLSHSKKTLDDSVHLLLPKSPSILSSTSPPLFSPTSFITF